MILASRRKKHLELTVAKQLRSCQSDAVVKKDKFYVRIWSQFRSPLLVLCEDYGSGQNGDLYFPEQHFTWSSLDERGTWTCPFCICRRRLMLATRRDETLEQLMFRLVKHRGGPKEQLQAMGRPVRLLPVGRSRCPAARSFPTREQVLGSKYGWNIPTNMFH